MTQKRFLSMAFSVVLLCPGLLWAEQNSASGRAPKADYSYKVGVGDVIQVVVLQPDKMDLTLTVAPDGTVVFPQIGQIHVHELTPLEIQKKIERALREYFNYPLVSVSLKESNSQNFYVYGEVLKPGVYPRKENFTILQSIALAGGFTRFASLSDIKVVRQNPKLSENQTMSVDLNGSARGGTTNVFVVEPGDVITVSRSRDVYVYGEVQNPGPYPMEENTTILQAIVMAGGFTPVASKSDVKVTRQKPGSEKKQTVSVDLKDPHSGYSANGLKAEPGDVITVSKRFF